MKKKFVAFLSLAVVLAGLTVSVSAQKGNKVKSQDPYEITEQERAAYSKTTATPLGTLIQYDHSLP